jgi:hypothetical protein
VQELPVGGPLPTEAAARLLKSRLHLLYAVAAGIPITMWELKDLNTKDGEDLATFLEYLYAQRTATASS